MTSAGARGQTAEEMAKTLHFTLPAQRLHPAMGALIKDLAGDKNKTYQLRIANALWGQQGFDFQREFLDLTKADYGAELQAVDFKETEKARQHINGWVAEQTQDKIKELLKPGILDAETRLVLTNAIYFQSNWLQRFEKEQTKPGKWKLAAEKSIEGVPLMHQVLEEANYYETNDLQLVEIPYQGGELSMVVVLPRKEADLSKVEQSLSATKLPDWLKAGQPRKVDLTLPRFKVTAAVDLKSVLTQMGMGLAFSNAADFSGIAQNEKLLLSAVIHQAFVEVDEKGTEAAAATAVVVKPKSVKPDNSGPVVFRADHPFVFLIRDHRTNSILFLGRLINPSA
jgi:serpin B